MAQSTSAWAYTTWHQLSRGTDMGRTWNQKPCPIERATCPSPRGDKGTCSVLASGGATQHPQEDSETKQAGRWKKRCWKWWWCWLPDPHTEHRVPPAGWGLEPTCVPPMATSLGCLCATGLELPNLLRVWDPSGWSSCHSQPWWHIQSRRSKD